MSNDSSHNSTTLNAKFLSPKFTAMWPHLGEPDTKFNADGVYSVTAVMDPNDPANVEFLSFLNECGDKAIADAKAAIAETKANPAKKRQMLEALILNPVVDPEFDQDGNETGMVLVRFKSKATRKHPKTGEITEVSIRMCDARRMPIDPKVLPIGNGSIMRVNGVARSNYVPSTNRAFVTLYIGSVQLIKLVEFGGGGFDDFGEEEGGYYGDGESATSRAAQCDDTDFDPDTFGGSDGDTATGDF